MIIDFHTHCFPDTLAPRAMAQLSSKIEQKPFADGTANGLIRLMDECGIDRCVVQNIATNPKQQNNVNLFAKSLLAEEFKGRLIPFGSVHPFGENLKETLLDLKRSGVKGIKLHPDYTKNFIDSDEFRPVFSACCEYGVIVLIHAGWDPESPDVTHAPPQRIRRVLDEYKGLKFVAAHFGGVGYWNDVQRYLVGTDIYIDTSLACDYGMNALTAKWIIENHSPGKILFASDAPWSLPSKIKDYMLSLNLSEAQQNDIFYENAKKLLDM